MTFSDDYLKILKEDCEREVKEYGRTAGVEYQAGHLLDLFARLEASERHNAVHCCYDSKCEAGIAWRKAAVKE